MESAYHPNWSYQQSKQGPQSKFKEKSQQKVCAAGKEWQCESYMARSRTERWQQSTVFVCLFVCLYLSSLLFWLIDAIHSKILLPGSYLFLHKLVKWIKLLTLSLPRSCWVILLVIYHNPYDVSVENLVLDQLINPWLIFLFILLTCLLDIVSIL